MISEDFKKYNKIYSTYCTYHHIISELYKETMFKGLSALIYVLRGTLNLLVTAYFIKNAEYTNYLISA